MPDEGEAPDDAVEAPKKPSRPIEDPLAANIRKAFESQRALEPPEKRKPTAFGTWIKQPKIRDDIFTRTVANVASITIIGAGAAAFGVIHLGRQSLAALVFFGGLLVTAVVANVAPVRYFRPQIWRWLVVFVMVIISTAIALYILGAFNARPTTWGCDDLFGSIC